MHSQAQHEIGQLERNEQVRICLRWNGKTSGEQAPLGVIRLNWRCIRGDIEMQEKTRSERVFPPPWYCQLPRPGRVAVLADVHDHSPAFEPFQYSGKTLAIARLAKIGRTNDHSTETEHQRDEGVLRDPEIMALALPLTHVSAGARRETCPIMTCFIRVTRS